MRLNHTLLYHPQNPVMAAKTGKTKMMRLLRDDNAKDQDTQIQAERIDMDTHSQIISRKRKQGCQRRSRRLKEATAQRKGKHSNRTPPQLRRHGTRPHQDREEVLLAVDQAVLLAHDPRLPHQQEGPGGSAKIPSKRLRNKIVGFSTHLMKRIQKGPVHGISLKLQEEENEGRMDFVPDESAMKTDEIVVDKETLDMLTALGMADIPGVKKVDPSDLQTAPIGYGPRRLNQ